MIQDVSVLVYVINIIISSKLIKKKKPVDNKALYWDKWLFKFGIVTPGN
jgi:hypothetical protein